MGGDVPALGVGGGAVLMFLAKEQLMNRKSCVYSSHCLFFLPYHYHEENHSSYIMFVKPFMNSCN